jgi:hypothetical protein
VIEYDSVEHHTGTAAHYRDAARRNAISDLDHKVRCNGRRHQERRNPSRRVSTTTPCGRC